ncbi:transmembrane protein, putative (macronuclear) [Tetrahymena thermophila SB210]|uniref:Transmembrane protein, putative n=1 Tax=Tetrahymena thermophila (strain SB210) TaxID=312017 RepID=I7MHJ3_TETTS|nr:transmembrane protein, putative [Tetrahymena thermophila SB210]EAR87594.2 transmembrane protein, putative [Tetrahymena thermophila SB210]|eukprot:XP_001007839.2 transmembrane protein, putative [Tetrahymena thermophila SB210]
MNERNKKARNIRIFDYKWLHKTQISINSTFKKINLLYACFIFFYMKINVFNMRKNINIFDFLKNYQIFVYHRIFIIIYLFIFQISQIFIKNKSFDIYKQNIQLINKFMQNGQKRQLKQNKQIFELKKILIKLKLGQNDIYLNLNIEIPALNKYIRFQIPQYALLIDTEPLIAQNVEICPFGQEIQFYCIQNNCQLFLNKYLQIRDLTNIQQGQKIYLQINSYGA